MHAVVFQVANREGLATDADGNLLEPLQLDGVVTLPEPWETGWKDTVTALAGQVTRVRATFATPGQFVWHCQIVEHEDNEMSAAVPHRPRPAERADAPRARRMTVRTVP